MKARYIDKELEEGKPNSRFSDYPQFPGVAGWLASIWQAFGVHASARQMLASRRRRNARLRVYSHNFRIVRRSAIGPFLAGPLLFAALLTKWITEISYFDVNTV